MNKSCCIFCIIKSVPTVILSLSFFSMVSKDLLSLEWVKGDNGELSTSFVQKLATLTKAPVFIETGTFKGQTAYNASLFFKTVHTTELGLELYQAASKRFLVNTGIHVHLGNSPYVLKTILPHIQDQIIFWLDAHYSCGQTAKGDSNTPVMQELAAINESGIKNAIILIDDMRLFDHLSNTPINDSVQGYPTVDELKKAILAINPNYCFEIFGDIAMAFLPEENFAVSAVIHACTISRSFDNNDYFLEEVLAAEKIISQAAGAEAQMLKYLPTAFSNSEKLHGTGKHYHLWKGLVLAHEGSFAEACQELSRAYELGLKHTRIERYMFDIASKSTDKLLIDTYCPNANNPRLKSEAL